VITQEDVLEQVNPTLEPRDVPKRARERREKSA
jgi:hypothetical protein